MTLHQRGIEIWPRFFAPILPELRVSFESALTRTLTDRYDQKIFAEMDDAIQSCGQDSLTLRLTAAYLGIKKARMSAFRGKRLLPHEPIEYDAFQWHHDGEGKRVRMMVYLSDVGPNDQRMEYIAGSHTALWPGNGPTAWPGRPRQLESYLEEYPDAECVQCIGPAGTAILFDSNGLHRGIRSMNSTRDNLNFRYVPDTWRQTIKDRFQAAMIRRRDR